MGAMKVLRRHYRLFGMRGVWLATSSALTRRRTPIEAQDGGIAHPVQLRPRTTDVQLFEQIICREEYRLDIDLRPKVIVDAGANIGLTSVYYANRYPEARIFAIEPEASNFAMLKRNTAPYPTIVPIQGALWRESVALELSNPDAASWAFQTREAAAASATAMPGMTVDELMAQHGIDFIDLLKVDIEGAEKEVFERAHDWIDRVGAIAVELHDRFKPGCSESVFAATRDFAVTRQRGETMFLYRDRALPAA